MTEQPTVVVAETPKRKFHVKLPSRSFVTKTAALTGAFFAGAWVAKRKLDSDCACENDATEQTVTTDN